jgi:7-cyano-7-deazaguanine synthase
MLGDQGTLTSTRAVSTRERCLVLLSGGVDSATLVFWMAKSGYETECLYLDYAQGHRNRERECARSVANELGVKLTVIEVPLPSDSLRSVTSSRADNAGLFVNVVGMCAISTAFALDSGIEFVALGINADDVKLHPALQRRFFRTMERLSVAWVGNKIRMLTPFLHMDKSSVAMIGVKLGVPFGKTWSCSVSVDVHCGRCADCAARRVVLGNVGLTDQTEYEVQVS